MKSLSSGLRVSLSKLFMGIILLAFVKGGTLLLLGGLPVLAPHLLSPSSPEIAAVSKKEDITLALQAMQAAIAQASAEAAQVGEAPKQEIAKQDAVDSGETSYSEQVQSLKRRQQEVSRREQDLRALHASLEKKIAELKKLEAGVKKMLEEADVTKDQKVAHLVSVYANMKPQQAAQVLETLEDKLAVKILAGMNGRTAGKILSYVKAARAAGLSEKLTRLQIPFAE